MLRALSLLAGDEAEQPVPEPVVVNLQMGGKVGVVKLAPSTPLASINGLCDALIAGGSAERDEARRRRKSPHTVAGSMAYLLLRRLSG